jgi:CHAT domain-containing protein
MWSMKRNKSSFLVYFLKLIIELVIAVSALVSCNNNPNPTTKSNSPEILLKRAEALSKRAEYDSSLKYYKQASIEFRRLQDWESLIRTEIDIADYYRIKGQLDDALKQITETESLGQKKLNANSIAFADIYHKKGIILSNKGNFIESNILLNKSISLRISHNGTKDTLLSLSYNGLGTNFLYIGKFDEALKYYNKTIAIAVEGNKTKDEDFAMFYQNLGIVFANKGDYEKAVYYFLQSLDINKKVLSAHDLKLAQIYQNLGRLYQMTDKYKEALDYFDLAEEIYINKFGIKNQNLASIFHNKGGIYTYQADYEKALNYFNKALTIYKDNLNPDHPNILSVLINIGYVYEMQSNYNEALKYYLQSIPKDENSPYIIKSYRNLANIYFILKNNQAADKYFKLAIDKSQKLIGPKSPEAAFCYLYYGNMLSLRNHYGSEGLKMFYKSLDIFKEVFGSKNRDVADAYKYIGVDYSYKGEYIKSLEFYQKSLIAGFPSFSDTSFFTNPKVSKNTTDYYLLEVINKKADALYALYNSNNFQINYLKSSFQTYALAVEMIEKLRSSYQSEESKLLISGMGKNAFLKAMNTSVLLYKKTGNKYYLDEALKYTEKSKAAVLLATMRDSEAKQMGNLPADLKDEEKTLKVELASYNKFIFEEKQNTKVDQGKIKLWSDKVFEINQKYDSLVKVIEVKYPAYFNLKYNNEVIEAKSIKNHLHSDQALIEYTLTDSLLYTFVFADKRMHIIQTLVDSSFIAGIRKLKDITGAQGNQDFNKANYEQFVSASCQLYNTLIAPAKQYVKNKRLIIIPDAEIGYISFDILLTRKPKPDETDFRDLPYLIAENSISYAVSATLLFNDFKKTGKKIEHRLLAFAPTYNNIKNLDIKNLTNKRNERDFLMPIPGVQKEVENISKIFSSRVYEDKQATEANFKADAGNYGLLHLAMHTIINDENPLYSKLVFYQNDDKQNDGLLNTYELFNMDLNAQLAVLSACNTGAGLLQRGEGIMSLARGFFYAGVPSIVMTLWSVEDFSGVELMTSFYTALAEGKTKDVALQQAKLNYLRNTDQLKAHPHFWAAYVSIGDTAPLDMNKRNPYLWYYISLSVILIAGISFIVLKVRHRNNMSR